MARLNEWSSPFRFGCRACFLTGSSPNKSSLIGGNVCMSYNVIYKICIIQMTYKSGSMCDGIRGNLWRIGKYFEYAFWHLGILSLELVWRSSHLSDFEIHWSVGYQAWRVLSTQYLVLLADLHPDDREHRLVDRKNRIRPTKLVRLRTS